MRTFLLFGLVFFAFSAIPLLTVAQKQSPKKNLPEIDIQYKKIVLENGLTLLVHEDHKAPIVAVNVWYHVGSKNEKERRTGFAHLFEHLMFNGSENFDDDYFQALERVGATDLNGTTSEDRTNYFQNVPVSAVDLALWMESDRMGHLVGVISQKKLDEQRGVVQNEKRQGDNQPYAVAEELITKATWPATHPYAHTVIGSMEDLNAASLDDVKEWFKTYYGAANAVLVVAGDIDANTALEKVKKYFGDIPSGPPVAHFNSWTAKRTGEQRQSAQDRVPQARLYKVWNMPAWGTPEFEYLKLLTNVLASGKTSRLYKRLVYDDQIATNVNSYLDEREIASQFYIEATAKPGDDLKKVEAAVNEELAKLIKSGPTEKELERVKTQSLARFVRGIERIGGFGGKSDILAMNQVYGGSPDFYKTTLKRIQNATIKDLQDAAKEWLSDGAYVLEIFPFPNYSESQQDTTVRKTLPKVGEAPEATFPKLERTVLSNGLKVILAERKSVPVVNFNLLFDAGYAADQFAAPGTANLAMNMMDEGTATRNALQISDELAMLGANLGTGSNLDMSTVSLSALKSNLDASLAIFADVVLKPSFPKEDFDRLQKQTIAGIQREKTQPIQMGYRVMPKLLYGSNHAYSTPLTGSGTEESVAKMNRDDMVKFYQTWIKPNIATMIVVGDITLGELKPRLEKLFSGWKAGDVPKKNLATINLPAHPSVYILDKPGAGQSIIFPANLTLPKNNPDAIAIEAMNTILGGSFTSRINMNLREDKHWSYGSGSFVFNARGQQPFIGYGIVQTDKTKESIMELNKEFRDILGPRPATSGELAKVQSSMTLELPGSWETNNAVMGSVAEMVRFDYNNDYFETFVKKIKGLTLDNISRAAKIVVHPDNMVWVVVGDRSKIEAGIRELGYGEVKLIDSNGNIVQ
ncbi:MAG: insulinase family protein [Ignavibacteriae bacterium]|nr:MAG: insulinase family protein [Ignavibacteriota bacterium]